MAFLSSLALKLNRLICTRRFLLLAGDASLGRSLLHRLADFTVAVVGLLVPGSVGKARLSGHAGLSI